MVMMLTVVTGMMITIPHPPYLIYHPKVLLLTLRRSSVGVTKTVKLTSEIQKGKGRIVTQGRREGGGRLGDNHSSHPLSFIPPQSTTSYTKMVKRRGHQNGQTD